MFQEAHNARPTFIVPSVTALVLISRVSLHWDITFEEEYTDPRKTVWLREREF